MRQTDNGRVRRFSLSFRSLTGVRVEVQNVMNTNLAHSMYIFNAIAHIAPQICMTHTITYELVSTQLQFDLAQQIAVGLTKLTSCTRISDTKLSKVGNVKLHESIGQNILTGSHGQRDDQQTRDKAIHREGALSVCIQLNRVECTPQAQAHTHKLNSHLVSQITRTNTAVRSRVKRTVKAHSGRQIRSVRRRIFD